MGWEGNLTLLICTTLACESCGSHSILLYLWLVPWKPPWALSHTLPHNTNKAHQNSWLNGQGLSIFPFGSSSHLVFLFPFPFLLAYALPSISPCSVFKGKEEWAIKVHKYSVLLSLSLSLVFFFPHFNWVVSWGVSLRVLPRAQQPVSSQ